MFRVGKRLLAGPFSLLPNFKDEPDSNVEIELRQRLSDFEAAVPDSPWERVKFVLLTKDQYGMRSPHSEYIIAGTVSSTVVGLFYGGVRKGQVAYEDFVRTNQATRFITHMDAKRRLQDKISIAFFSGAAKFGWRTGLFSFMFMTVSTAVAIYRNKDGIMEYSLGGAAAGMAYRIHLGWQRILVGGILGLCMGTAGGIVSYSVLKLANVSMIDVRYAHSRYESYLRSKKKEFNSSVDTDQLDPETSAALKARTPVDESSVPTIDKLENITN